MDGWGNDTADWLDERIEYARRWYQGGDQNWVWNGSVNSVADFSRIGADVFRLGSGAGCALYNDQVSGYDKAWTVAADGGRVLAVAGVFGGLLGKAAQVAKRLRKGPKSATAPSANSTANSNPFQGPVTKPVNIVDDQGNVIRVGRGQSVGGSPDGRYIQVKNSNGRPTGLRKDGGHKPTTHPDLRGQQPHAHVPGKTNPDGTPWLPINQ